MPRPFSFHFEETNQWHFLFHDPLAKRKFPLTWSTSPPQARRLRLLPAVAASFASTPFFRALLLPPMPTGPSKSTAPQSPALRRWLPTQAPPVATSIPPFRPLQTT